MSTLELSRAAVGYAAEFQALERQCTVQLHTDDPALAQTIAEQIHAETLRIAEGITQTERTALLPYADLALHLSDGKLNLDLYADGADNPNGIACLLPAYAVDRAAALATQRSDCPVLVQCGGDAARADRPPLHRRAWELLLAGSGQPQRIEVAAGSVASSCQQIAATPWSQVRNSRRLYVARAQCLEARILAMLAVTEGSDAKAFLEQQNCPYWQVD